MKIEITESEWLAELERLAKQRRTAGLTAREFAEKLDVCYQTGVKILGKLKRAGRIRCVKKTITTLNDRSFLTDAYIVLPEAKRKVSKRPRKKQKNKRSFNHGLHRFHR